ncbi:hypothetical protein F2Q69_00028736 [Brassica cretica]|uniref:Uncharacterized protein n=1 Tax=Brassica cretica TaxID=69181 RepID=A0A8S9S9L7_BRACR|nr:hypothetical protein F2Q69_00028736 [Brassica cretica]
MTQRHVQAAQLEGPPGFPPLFPELSKEEQKMAMKYISHSNETERLARIQRVRQGIADSARESTLRLTRIKNEVDKGKGHVYSYPDESNKLPLLKSGAVNINSRSQGIVIREEEAESADTFSATVSAPAHIASGFQLGPSSEGRVYGSLKAGKTQRNRPSSWKRKSSPKLLIAPPPASAVDISQSPSHSAKRKQSSPRGASPAS